MANEGSYRTVELAGLKLAERKYGRGRGDGLSPRGYHNAPHAELVTRSVRTLLEDPEVSEALAAEDLKLLPLAAAWHDVVYEPGNDDNETKSSMLLKGKMLRIGFPKGEAERAADLILATVADIGDAESGYRLVQSAKDLAGQVLCDADVSSWGLPWDELVPWWHGLACELAGVHDYVEDFDGLPVAGVRSFLAGQADLLASHRYQTAAAERLWGKNRSANAVKTRELIDGLT